jgi:uncharacterized membrane protein
VDNGEVEARYEARREAASAALVAGGVLVLLASVSRHEGWELTGLPWWAWLILAGPSLVLCVDLWLGARPIALSGTRTASLALLAVIVLGNLIGVGVVVAGLVTTGTDELGGGQLLVTAASIWIGNVIAFGLVYWDLDDGGPLERAQPRHERRTPDFQFPQDENPRLAHDAWRPRIWDYLFVSLTSGTAFSPTDAMPLTLHAKALVAVESVVSLVLVVLVTARAVNVLAS